MQGILVIIVILVIIWLFLPKRSISVIQIGRLNIASTRNVNHKLEYVLIQKFSELTDKDFKNANAKTLEVAVDVLLRQYRGDFLSNVTLYQVTYNKEVSYAIEADVWAELN